MMTSSPRQGKTQDNKNGQNRQFVNSTALTLNLNRAKNTETNRITIGKHAELRFFHQIQI